MPDKNPLPKIVYSCYFDVSREGEQFIPEHIFSYQNSGSLAMNIGTESYTFNEGDFRFCKRNTLVKFVKQPPEGGEFKALSIRIDQEALRQLSRENGYSSDHKYEGGPIISLDPDPLFKTYIDSLMPYLTLQHGDNEPLFSLKVKEAVLILLRAKPELKDILFDFTEPGKIDLEEFMLNNYHFNVGLNRYAYLSGRSLATFKRDFEKIFHTSPSRWLLQKRLQEAYYQIKEKGMKPTDIYLDLGFEDLSHFSYAFKNAFGHAPSKI
ncbi:helix-turn-helix domain-containing protein [Ohtaekwangia koreensis]|uniref:AraC-type DNA-binding protein n=1 Tax=Ohtaekwangia koreensis TaxID=688867 RepID=A0A1T5M6T4_9BACT|nr:AraC family transcriptional regulator [Ohtaekwangia koreensis]SKC83937.1 AraC-type DNA-binding protein [Ohtaekwangia koreensis]